MAELIDRAALLAEYDRVHVGEPGGARALIANAPTVDAVLRGVYDQCAWERIVALEQLHDVELSLGEKTDDVVKVVRCKDCVYNENGQCTHSEDYDDTRYRPDYYCADGERKDDE